MSVITNNVPRPILSWEDLTPAQQKEADGPGCLETGYFVYKGEPYRLDDFVRLEPFSKLSKGGWDGVMGTSAFTGIVIKLVEGGEAVVIGMYFS